MTEIKPGEAEGEPTDDATSAEDSLAALDALLDLATSKYIEEDCSNLVVQDEAEIWQWLTDAGHAGSTESAKTADTVTDHGDGSVTVEVLLNQDLDEDHPDGKVTFYVEQGEAWKAVRSQFEYVRRTVESAVSFSFGKLHSSAVQMDIVCDRLKPSTDMAGNADSLLALDIGDTSSSETIAKAFDVSDNWAGASAVSGALAEWTGVAAETFRGVYTDRIPSIAAGQLMVAMVLQQSMSTVAEAFKHLRIETDALISDVITYLDIFPDTVLSEAEEDTDWAGILTAVSGIATVVAGAAAPAPPLTAIAAGATIIAGAATLGAMLCDDPTYQAAVSAPIPIEGDTVALIMSNFDSRVQTYIEMAENTEKFMARTVSGYEDFFIDQDAKGIVVPRTYDDDLELTRFRSFFELNEPTLSSIDSDTSYSSVSDTDSMGEAPDSGKSFAGDLEKLLKSGNVWLPDMASSFDSCADSGADDGLEEGFQRQTTQQNDAVGEFTQNSTGSFYPVWMSLYGNFTSMVANTGSNLRSAGEGLIAAANSYASQDDAAATELTETSNYFKP